MTNSKVYIKAGEYRIQIPHDIEVSSDNGISLGGCDGPLPVHCRHIRWGQPVKCCYCDYQQEGGVIE